MDPCCRNAAGEDISYYKCGEGIFVTSYVRPIEMNIKYLMWKDKLIFPTTKVAGTVSDMNDSTSECSVKNQVLLNLKKQIST